MFNVYHFKCREAVGVYVMSARHAKRHMPHVVVVVVVVVVVYAFFVSY